MAPSFHIAQSNIAHMRAPMDDPMMEGFVARLDPLNALADQSPGFVWRLESAEGEVSPVATFSGQRVLFNMSVWDSFEALEAYVYKSNHVKAVQKRAEWFERSAKSPLVLWWIAAGHIPTEQEAEQRFELLWQNGPTPDAFTFRTRFEPEA
ncbi:MAG: DUF3291 domain-containing protein [Woeseiaceae bacterium]